MRVLETLVLQLRATLATAQAALAEGSADRPKVYTVAEVADIVGCSEETVRRRIRDARLDAVTSGAPLAGERSGARPLPVR